VRIGISARQADAAWDAWRYRAAAATAVELALPYKGVTWLHAAAVALCRWRVDAGTAAGKAGALRGCRAFYASAAAGVTHRLFFLFWHTLPRAPLQTTVAFSFQNSAVAWRRRWRCIAPLYFADAHALPRGSMADLPFDASTWVLRPQQTGVLPFFGLHMTAFPGMACADDAGRRWLIVMAAAWRAGIIRRLIRRRRGSHLVACRDVRWRVPILHSSGVSGRSLCR